VVSKFRVIIIKNKKMKKILFLTILLVAFVISGANVEAQQLGDGELKVTDIKIHKKKVLSDEERKALDEAKGKPARTDKKISLPAFWATGTGVLLPEGGKRYAIVAGLANYTGTVNDLCVIASETSLADVSNLPTDDPRHYCQDYDSMHIKEALNESGFDGIILLRDGEATRDAIKGAMETLKGQVTENDEVVFFFSGHGVSGKVAGDKEAINEAIFTYDNKYIWDDELSAWAEELAAYRAVFAFDICKAGGMSDIAKKNRVIVMSSGENQSSWTYSLGGAISTTGEYLFSEGLFSHSFVEDGMNNKLADGFNLISSFDGKVAVEEAFSYAYPIVKVKQTPVLNDQFINDFLF